MRKYKKQIIIILCVLATIIVTSVTFCLTLFTVKDIKIDFRTSTVYSYSNSEIIEKSEFVFGKDKFSVKVSIGVAQYLKNGKSAKEIIKSADTALYKSKENGRNRVTKA